jgi:phage tail protein X
MTDTYLTRQGDMADAIAYARYGYTAGATEALLAANPGLADLGPALPANVTVILPPLAAPGPAVLPTVDLWS